MGFTRADQANMRIRIAIWKQALISFNMDSDWRRTSNQFGCVCKRNVGLSKGESSHEKKEHTSEQQRNNEKLYECHDKTSNKHEALDE